MTSLTNDNALPGPAPAVGKPDAYGRAALLLVESLLHTLIARSLIPVEEIIAIVTVAIDAEIEITADLGEGEDIPDKSRELLSAIRQSLSNDIR